MGWSASSSLSVELLIQLHAYALGKQQMVDKELGTLSPMWETYRALGSPFVQAPKHKWMAYLSDLCVSVCFSNKQIQTT